MVFFRLPTSGIGVYLREPAGAEDALLAEAGACDAALAVALLSALAQPAEAEELDWGSLPMTDVDAALLRVRQLVLGDHVRADVVCPEGGCGQRIDVAFRVSEYLAHHAPRTTRGVLKDDEAGWFRLARFPVSFRPPSFADLSSLPREADAARALAERCIRPARVPARVRRRIEAAMEALSPCLHGELDAVCAECGTAVRVAFDPQSYVLRELRAEAHFLFEEVHLIAGRYHWSERDILALPRRRRARYVELAHAERSVV
jgi:hypothetical protein